MHDVSWAAYVFAFSEGKNVAAKIWPPTTVRDCPGVQESKNIEKPWSRSPGYIGGASRT